MAAATVRCNICKTHFFATSMEEVMDDLNRHREERHGISREEVEAATEYDLEFLHGVRISTN